MSTLPSWMAQLLQLNDLINIWLNLWPKWFAAVIFWLNLVRNASLDCSSWKCCYQVKHYKIVFFLGTTKQGAPAWRNWCWFPWLKSHCSPEGCVQLIQSWCRIKAEVPKEKTLSRNLTKAENTWKGTQLKLRVGKKGGPANPRGPN